MGTTVGFKFRLADALVATASNKTFHKGLLDFNATMSEAIVSVFCMFATALLPNTANLAVALAVPTVVAVIDAVVVAA